ncbi:MAG: RNA 2'-phosphotransferase [candidate division WOR-3 bacterium]|nr:MAG: RNA 2'-phosphotransferase [candidate division WOR-3 bacterium]
MDSKYIRISKFLSLVLRHKPETIGLILDSEGWADVGELIKKSFDAGVLLDRPILRQVVEGGEKKRFSFDEDGSRIRANYGHSIPVTPVHAPAEPPEFLYHGTATQFLQSIDGEGVGPGTRQYVHLVEEEKTAVEVGSRHGEPVVVVVQARAMHEKGFEFFKTESGIWLTREVPREYVVIQGSSP